MKCPLSVIILTLNEEAVIDRCIDCVIDWADEVLVVDSGSTDRTKALALARGAKVIDQPWLGWVPQHHAGMDAAQNDWCMKLDADEIVDDELGQAIVAALARDPEPTTGFVVTRIEEFCSHLMPSIRRQSKGDTFVRIMNRRYSRFDENMLIHEEVRVTGPLVRLRGRLLHWRAFDLTGRFQQNNRNSTIEARVMLLAGTRPTFWRIAAMPLLRFLWCYVYAGCWQLGRLGLVYSMQRASAEFMRQAKLWEFVEVRALAHPPHVLYKRNDSNAGCPDSTEVPLVK